MAIFDAAIFDSAIFDTGETVSRIVFGTRPLRGRDRHTLRGTKEFGIPYDAYTDRS